MVTGLHLKRLLNIVMYTSTVICVIFSVLCSLLQKMTQNRIDARGILQFISDYCCILFYKNSFMILIEYYILEINLIVCDGIHAGISFQFNLS